MVNLGIIGCGHWGINLIRNFLQTDKCTLRTVCESSSERRDYVKELYEDVNIISDHRDLLEDNKIDAVVISTPPSSHYDIAKSFLLAGKHTFVEKPLSLNYANACELVELADSKKRVLMAGHTVIYNDAIKMVKDIINSGEIGEIYYIYASRLNLGKVKSDINVMWNLAPHDVSVILYLLERKPISVSAKGLSYIQNNIDDVVYLNITFEDNINAQIHLSWLDPSKKREITIVGSKKMLVYDDISDERIKIYDKGIDIQNKDEFLGEYRNFGEYQLIQRAGEVVIPKVNLNEPLRNECQHFIDCIIENKEPLTSGRSALDVVKILETADRSIADSGREILIN
jgi:predicted dehydrogenase